MTLDEFVASYFDYNRLGAHHRQQFMRGMREYEAFAGPLEAITPESFRAFLADCLARGLHVNTVRLRGNYLRTYVKHAWEAGDIADGVYLRVRQVKNPRGATNMSTPRPYTHDEIRAFYAWLDQRYTPRKKLTPQWIAGVRDGRYRIVRRRFSALMNVQARAVVSLALDGGLRRNELRYATLDDVDPQRNEAILVRMGKAKISGVPRYREVPYTERCRLAMATWLELREAIMVGYGAQHDSLWINLRAQGHADLLGLGAGRAIGEAMSEKAQERLLQPWSVQRLRHTCGTNWLRAGMPLEVVQRLLGHASLRQTLAYAQIDRSDLFREAKRAERRFIELTGE